MFDPGQDQAAGLRRLLRQPPLRLLPVVGAGPHADASALAAGLADEYRAAGCRTLLIEGQGAAGAAGVTAPVLDNAVQRVRWPAHLLEGAADPAAAAAWFHEILIAHSGFDHAVVAVTEALAGPLFARLASETLVLCGPGRDDLASAYALVKRLACAHGLSRFRLLFMGMDDPGLALRRQRRFAGLASRHLDVDVGLAGSLASVATGSARLGGGALATVVQASRGWRLATIGAAVPALH